eukprot:SAG31_NODE_34163_length_335_cov_13.491525_1_plen_64_part_10
MFPRLKTPTRADGMRHAACLDRADARFRAAAWLIRRTTGRVLEVPGSRIYDEIRGACLRPVYEY